MTNRSTRILAVLTASAAIGAAGVAPAAFARHGADDPVTHDAGDDHGVHHGRHHHHARRADDRGRHHGHGRHHRRHHDDGPNHR